MHVRTLVVGPYQTNCYLLSDSKEGRCWIVDPGNNAPFLLDALREAALPLKAILLTHAHWDHLTALAAVHAAWPDAPIYVGEGDREFLGKNGLKRYEETGADCGFLVQYHDELAALPEATNLLLGGESLFDGTIRVIATPGHTKGGMSYYLPGERLLFPGDTLFAGSIGRTDLYGGSYAQIILSLQKLKDLPPETVVLPGHGPETTMAQELAENPYF